MINSVDPRLAQHAAFDRLPRDLRNLIADCPMDIDCIGMEAYVLRHGAEAVTASFKRWLASENKRTTELRRVMEQ